MKDDDRGEECLVAMAVAEATGRGPEDLEQRVLQRLCAAPAAARTARRPWLAAAALLLGGTAVVVAVAVTMRRDGDALAVAQRAQDATPPVIFVLGDVENARVALQKDMTLLDVVFAARVRRDAELGSVTLLRTKALVRLVIDVDVREMLKTGKTTANVLVAEGDVLVVPSKDGVQSVLAAIDGATLAPGDRARLLGWRLELTSDLKERLQIASELGKLGRDAGAAVPQLVHALESDLQVARESATALGRIGAQATAALPALARLFDHADAALRERSRSADEQIRAAAAAQQSQDPQPAKPAPRITDADVPKRADHAFAARPAIDCIEQIGRDAKLPFASAVLDKAVTVKLTGATPRQALGAVAAAAGAHLEQHGAVLAVVAGEVSPEGSVTLKLGATPIHELFEQVARQAHLNLVVAGTVTGDVAVDVTDCPGRDLVALLAGAVGAEVAGRGHVLAIVPQSQVPLPRVQFSFDSARARPHSAVKEVLLALSRITRLTVQGDDAMTGPVSVLAGGQLRPIDIVQAIAATQGHEVGRADGEHFWRKADGAMLNIGWQRGGRERGAFEIERALTFFAAPLSFTTPHRLDGTVWLFLDVAPRAHVLAAIAAVAGGQVEPREQNVVEFVR